MTIRELIARLMTFDPDAEVAVVYWDSDEGDCCTDINGVAEAAGHYRSDTSHVEIII